MNVVLIGLRGTGKSTCGRALAKRLGWLFLDTDEIVQERAGRTIRALFEEGGEELFRALESEAVRQAARHANAVIASGGGAILDSENVSDLRRQGFVIHLSASPQELWRRIEGDTLSHAQRPPLQKGAMNGPQELERLLLARAAAYSAARDCELHVEGRAPEQLVDAMVLLLKARGILPHSFER